ncbi:hypothetical protein PF010_g2371 [Phytophthora fragariae]|uniref:Uncharacterized protein n=1 Tax=Phytophthora fragariae TaxID=53985 RepID=A0A6A3L5L0_9STRA|nr:hypothetical protein PF011_g9585 [Phytophthora fragariae]KAE9134644.1 hypothetical protein PF010_g2371 [Phytophthora fragariae]KAE9253870.1 hypothetical protein PF004_g1273 [Phytophthora fragariae]KAE9362242.1 hypothetical protein PF008_g227 [Phytophthora fragariae]
MQRVLPPLSQLVQILALSHGRPAPHSKSRASSSWLSTSDQHWRGLHWVPILQTVSVSGNGCRGGPCFEKNPCRNGKVTARRKNTSFQNLYDGTSNALPVKDVIQRMLRFPATHTHSSQ